MPLATVQKLWPWTITNVDPLMFTAVAHWRSFFDGSISKMPFDVRLLVSDALWSFYLAFVRPLHVSISSLRSCLLENKTKHWIKGKENKRSLPQGVRESCWWQCMQLFQEWECAFFSLLSRAGKWKGKIIVQRVDKMNEHTVSRT